MATFIGCLLDVSGSMKSNIADEKDGTWARSIFQVIDDLIKHDVSRDNRVFAVSVGGRYKNIFDAIGTIKASKWDGRSEINTGPATYSTIKDVFDLLEQGGAKTIRKWARPTTVKEAVSEHQAQLILHELQSNREFLRKFVFEYLPAACRDWGGESGMNQVPLLGGIMGLTQSACSFVGSAFREATVGDIKDVVEQSMSRLADKILLDVNNNSVFDVKEAAKAIRGCVDAETLTKDRAKELLKIVEPFIYGGTPLCQALTKSLKLFSMAATRYPDHHRLLFVVSDGMADTSNGIDEIKSELRRLNVTVSTCYIAKTSHVKPRKLHSFTESSWERGAKFLFEMSSSIPTQYVTRAIFLQHGWEIDISNNETRLFAHANHPDNLKDVIALARNAVCCQDALSDLLVYVSLDVYINQKNSTMPAHDQGDDGTCYAHAAATVLHLAMHRVLGRDEGYPDFEELRDYLIDQHGRHGANTYNVLREVCPIYRLHCKKADINEAMKAIAAKRPVVAKFRLTDDEWEVFCRFFRQYETGILRKDDLDISRRGSNEVTHGHAVVLTSFNSECLHLMNSWGDNWADMGFFRVENSDVLGLEFIDVYWTENDLSQKEKEYYQSHGSEVADKLVRSLKALQVATFTCPSCRQSSKVTEFQGTLSRARCPRCNHEFNSKDGDGNILALNMYLTSLSR